VEVLNKILSQPSISSDIENAWQIRPKLELHRSKDSELLYETELDYRIYQGKNIYQFNHDNSFFDLAEISMWGVEENRAEESAKSRLKSKGYRDLKRGIYDEFDGSKTSKSQKQFVNELLERERGDGLTEEDVLLDCTEYRIGYRQVTNSTNERTLVATVLPKNVLCVNTVTTVQPYEIKPDQRDIQKDILHDAYKKTFSDKELFVAVGLLNSLPFDFLMRTKVDSHIVMYKLRESQMPRLTEGDEWFEYIWRRAARLNCYGEDFEEMRDRLGGIEPAIDPDEREEIQAELDAASFHAYGLDREQTAFILDDFHQVRDPRQMTDEYFDLVLEKYDELTE
jgi:hypothetical protein